MPEKVFVGKVDHFYDRVSVAAIILEEELAVGDKITIEKDENVVEQEVTSMQIDRADVRKAAKGDSVGIKTMQPVEKGSSVYKWV